jgi:ribosome-binding protein aMBF1 (putative translation factor)
MYDGGVILEAIAERHGAQRRRLGWSESELAREFEILREAIDLVVARRAPPAAEARAALDRMLEHVEHVSLSGFRHASPTPVAAG